MEKYFLGVNNSFFSTINKVEERILFELPFNFNFSKNFSVKLGEGEDGKLGHNNRITLDKPKLIEALRSKRIRDIACGSSHSAAISSSGELYTWGLYIHFAYDIY